MTERHEPVFLLSAARADQYPLPDRPELALVGRSNVGKSSFINALFQRKQLARTSAQPGRTRQLNYFAVDGAWYFVDMPGYGYAKISKAERARWERQQTDYLRGRENLSAVLVLVDFRHAPSADDQRMVAQLDAFAVPYFIIATKADKVKRNRWSNQLNLIKETLDLVTTDQILPVSAVDGTGIAEAWEIIEGIIAGDYTEDAAE